MYQIGVEAIVSSSVLFNPYYLSVIVVLLLALVFLWSTNRKLKEQVKKMGLDTLMMRLHGEKYNSYMAIVDEIMKLELFEMKRKIRLNGLDLSSAYFEDTVRDVTDTIYNSISPTVLQGILLHVSKEYLIRYISRNIREEFIKTAD